MFQCKHTIIQNTIVHDQCDVLNEIISRIVNTFFDVLRKIKNDMMEIIIQGLFQF